MKVLSFTSSFSLEGVSPLSYGSSLWWRTYWWDGYKGIRLDLGNMIGVRMSVKQIHISLLLKYHLHLNDLFIVCLHKIQAPRGVGLPYLSSLLLHLQHLAQTATQQIFMERMKKII